MASVDVKTTANIEVEGSEQKQKRELIVKYDFGDSLNSAVSAFGEDVVFEAFVAAAKISLQNIVRRMLEEGETNESIEAYVATWKVGQKQERSRRSAQEIFFDQLKNATPEERQALLAKIASIAG